MGKIITFYSYKGGVGRTMALANIAVLLSKWNFKVLMVDWDLEAPGLEHFFKGYLNLKKAYAKKGIIELLTDNDGGLLESGNILWKNFVLNIDLPDSKGQLDLVTAGRRGSGYFEKVRKLNLQEFYVNSKGGEKIEGLRKYWKEKYDYILIDSRTGITDIGGVCTIHLPDVVALLFTATDQSFEGALDVAEKATKAQREFPNDRYNVVYIPIPCRFDTSEEFKLSQKWLGNFEKKLARIYADWLPMSVKRREFLEKTKIPYSTYFSFGEKLPVLEHGTSDPTGLGYAYENIATLIANDLSFVENLLDDRTQYLQMAYKRVSLHQTKVYISYDHRDSKWVKEWLLPKLEATGIQTHVDFRDFEIGVPSLINMERAIEQCDKMIVVLSPDWVESEYANFEAAMLQTRDALNIQKKIIPMMLIECELPRRLEILTWADFRNKHDWDRQIERVTSHIGKSFTELRTIRVEYPEISPSVVDIARLPSTGYQLLGRQRELKLLDEMWDTEVTNIVSIIAYGGVGKSTLVNKWLEKMRWDNYRSAKKVFGWSFYSQGTGQRVTSADKFISEALTWFGDEDPKKGSPWDKGQRLADLIRKEKTLLILDGLEPLQSGYDFERGKIKDPALSILVTQLARNNNGLCVITTRENVAELEQFDKGVMQLNLEQISNEAGRALLRVGGVQGTDAELETASEEFGNHALAINLLGSYIHGIEGHHISNAKQITDLDIPEEKGRQPRRVIAAFEKRFGEGPKIQLLNILGLFDRPTELDAVKAIYSPPLIEGLTDQLKNLTDAQWNELLEELRACKLLARKSTHNPSLLSSTPLIREYFGEKLQKDRPEAWKEAHRRLYEYYKRVPEKLYGKELPDTLEEMEPLFAAVTYGCLAGRFQETFDDVYWRRISRSGESYITRNLGAFGADLATLSSFFDKHWIKPASGLRDHEKALVLNLAGFRLLALGRLLEATQSTEQSFEASIERQDWTNVAIAGDNLSQLYLILGDVTKAVEYGNKCVDYADKSGGHFQIYSKRTTKADAQHQLGELVEAKKLFEEAEEMQKKEQPEYPYLYAVPGFRFCDLMLSQGQYKEVLKRANQTLQWVIEERWLLDIALDKLSLGRAYLIEAVSQGKSEKGPSTSLRMNLGKAEDFLNQAVDGLREASQQDFIVRGLLARAELFLYQQSCEKARGDLEEAREIAERGEMNLFLADYHLEAARLCLTEGNKEKEAREHYEEAKKRVDDMGYHRRDPEVLLIRAELEIVEGDKRSAKVTLKKSKECIDEMGCHRWDVEVERLKKLLKKATKTK